MKRSAKDGESNAGPRSQNQGLEEQAVRALEAAFLADRWKASRSRESSDGYDLLCKKEGRTYALEVKAAAGRARRSQLQGLLANAILRVRHYAAQHGAQPIAIVVAPMISEGIARELEEYVQKFGDGIAWGAIDGRGRFDLHGPGLDSIQASEQQQLFENAPQNRERSNAEALNSFSDLGQWMLKVLLAPKVSERWLNAPRSPIAGVADLAQHAGVSPASASRFLASLEQSGHLVRAMAGLRIVRVKALMEAWRSASQRPVKERFVRFLIPSPEPREKLSEVLEQYIQSIGSLSEADASEGDSQGPGMIGKRACLGLFSASDALGVGFVRGAPIHLYAENLTPGFLKEFELQSVQHRAEADLIVRQPRFPESVFRASVQANGVPVADLLQCWLDLFLHPARGAEQAAEIENHLRFSEWEE
ncbi:MAG: AcrR family transcriptional regulator [Planctomycetota bacterium]|jgi:AcrR family transcriptional regulator